MSFNAIRQNKILAKISESTVYEIKHTSIITHTVLTAVHSDLYSLYILIHWLTCLCGTSCVLCCCLQNSKDRISGICIRCCSLLIKRQVCTVLPSKSDSDLMLCLQSYQGLAIDRLLVYKCLPTMPFVGLQCVIVVFPGHTHLLFQVPLVDCTRSFDVYIKTILQVPLDRI